jgi:hypothetical protein
MANEINIQASLTFQRDVIALQAAGTKPITQSPGTKGLVNQLSVSNVTGGSAVRLIDTATPPLASLGQLFVKNLDGSLSLDLALDNGFTNTFATLKAGEFCLLPVNKASLPSIYAKASAAGPIGVLVGAAEI